MGRAMTGYVTETAAVPRPPLASVEGTMKFTVDAGVKPATHITPPGEEPIRRGEFDVRAVTISDCRPIADSFSLEREGIAFREYATAVEDFYDDAEVEAVYYPEMLRLVMEATGAVKVLVFDHTRRVEGDDPNDGHRRPVRSAHNDYTEKSGPQRVRDLLPAAEAEQRLGARFSIINVWRPISGPVRAAPLAVCDAQSLASGDLVATDLIYPDRVGEVYGAAYGAHQRWYYFPDMERDEVILIKGHDTETDGRARFAPHTAFDDPTSPSDAAPRESIEIRTLAFF
jgi:hypothetical protein